jgi:hypothetical protein
MADRDPKKALPARHDPGVGGRGRPSTISRGLFMGAEATWTRTSIPQVPPGDPPGRRSEVVLAGAPTDWVGFLADGIDRRFHLESRLTRREQEVLKVAART